MSETIQNDEARLLTASEQEAVNLTLQLTGARTTMKSGPIIAALTALALVGPTAPADAAGCIKGAIAGGVAGHYAGGHGVLGAVGGCVVGRRLASNKAARERDAQLQQQNPVPYDGSSSRDPAHRQTRSDPRYSGTTAPVPRDDGSNVGSLYNGGAYRR